MKIQLLIAGVALLVLASADPCSNSCSRSDDPTGYAQCIIAAANACSQQRRNEDRSPERIEARERSESESRSRKHSGESRHSETKARTETDVDYSSETHSVDGSVEVEVKEHRRNGERTPGPEIKARARTNAEKEARRQKSNEKSMEKSKENKSKGHSKEKSVEKESKEDKSKDHSKDNSTEDKSKKTKATRKPREKKTRASKAPREKKTRASRAPKALKASKRPKTTRAPRTEKPKNKSSGRTPDEVFMNCCEQRSDIPEDCYQYCTYSKVTKGGIISSYTNKKCPNEALQPMFGCASQLQDNNECCDREKVGPEKCRTLCPRGVEDVTIGKDFTSCLNQVNKYGKCFKESVQKALDNGDELGW